MKALVGLLTLSSSLMVAHAQGQGVPRTQATVDSAGIRVVDNTLPRLPPACRVTGPVLTIGQADADAPDALRGVTGARRLSDGRIVLSETGNDELRFHDATGAFVSSTGPTGQDPSEFTAPILIGVTEGDSVWVGDVGPWRYHVFAPGGEYAHTVTVQPRQPIYPTFRALLDGGYTTTGIYDTYPPPTWAPYRVTVVLHGPSGQLVDTIGVYSLGRWARPDDVILEPFFEPKTSLDGAGRRFYVAEGIDPEVSVFEVGDGEYELVARVRWTPGDRTISEADVRAAKENLAQRLRLPGAPPEMASRVVAAMTSDEVPVADRVPASRTLVANRSGGFWVERYPRLPIPDETHWLSFDAEGHFVCELVLPPIEITDLDGDYLLAQQRADVDVEQVMMYRIANP